jgi:hypothetical protein
MRDIMVYYIRSLLILEKSFITIKILINQMTIKGVVPIDSRSK